MLLRGLVPNWVALELELELGRPGRKTDVAIDV